MRNFLNPYLSITFVAALLLVLAGGHLTAPSESRAGILGPTISVIDGDTLEVHGRIVQLYGIDAPELGQRCFHDGLWTPCGLEAAFELKKLIGMQQQPFRCAPPPNSPNHTHQVCLAAHLDIAHVLLESGYAVTTEESDAAYHEAEYSAKQARLGLWHTELVNPAEWRQGKRLPHELDAEDDSCPIKAVIAANGQRLYYVPTDDNYESVKVDPAKGDRLFCSDEQARQAGWRRPGEGAAQPKEG